MRLVCGSQFAACGSSPTATLHGLLAMLPDAEEMPPDQKLNLALVCHSLAWALMTASLAESAASIEAHFTRAVELRMESGKPELAAETLNGKVLPDPEGRRPTEAATALKAAQEALAKATEDDKEAPAELTEKVEAATKAAAAEAEAELTKELYVGRAQKKDERQRELR